MTSLISFERELRRLGVDPSALGGLAVAPPLTPEVMLRWLRWLPTGLGHAELMRRLRLGADAGGPAHALDHPDLSPADPGYRDEDLDVREALAHEIERVVWPALRAAGSAGATLGFTMTHGERAALANLRRLPDGADRDAVLAALAAPEPARRSRA